MERGVLGHTRAPRWLVGAPDAGLAHQHRQHAMAVPGHRGGCPCTTPPPPRTPQGHKNFVSSLAWEPAHLALPSARFCSGSKDATIRVWDAGTR